MNDKLLFRGKLNICCYTLLTFALVGCSQGKDQTFNEDINFVRSELVIDHVDLLLPSTFTFNKMVGKDSLLRYDGKSRILTLFNLRKSKVTKLIQFESEGPDFMEPFVRDILLTNGGYLIQSSNYLHFVNEDGSIEERIKTNQLQSKLTLDSFLLDRMNLLNGQSVVFSKILRSSMLPNQLDSPRTSIFRILNLEDKSIKDIPVYSPKETLVYDKTRGYFNSSNRQYFLINNNNIIFNYGFSPSIHVYNILEKTIRTYGAVSDMFNNKKEPFPSKDYKNTRALIHWSNQGVRFSNLAHDPINGLYLRIAASYYYNSSNELSFEKYLQAISSDYKVTKEVKLTETVFDHVFVSNGSIYLIPTRQEEGSSRFLKLTLKVN